MANIQSISKVFLPSWYNKRYTLELLVLQHQIDTGKNKREIYEELAQQLDVTFRTLYNWENQLPESKVAEISAESRSVIGNYFGVPSSDILSINCDTKV